MIWNSRDQHGRLVPGLGYQLGMILKVNEELNKKVNDFYNSDDISWQAPGRKDRVIYRSRNEYGKKQKEYVQSRYMLMSLGEAHELAIKEGMSISRSKFCSLKPKHIKLMERGLTMSVFVMKMFECCWKC